MQFLLLDMEQIMELLIGFAKIVGHLIGEIKDILKLREELICAVLLIVLAIQMYID